MGSRPKMGLAFLLGLQQYLTMFGATVLIPFIVGGAMKMPQEELALLISTMFFVSGITTLLQQSPLGTDSQLFRVVLSLSWGRCLLSLVWLLQRISAGRL